MCRILIGLCLLITISCVQRDTNPQQSDLLYRDLKKELDLVSKNVAAIEIEYAERLNELKSVVPQTGQIKSYEKKVFESKNNLVRLQQQKLFFEISLKQREEYVRSRYKEVFRGGRPWPDIKELETFEKSQKFQREKIAWEKNKGMVKSVPRGTGEVKKEIPTH